MTTSLLALVLAASVEHGDGRAPLGTVSLTHGHLVVTREGARFETPADWFVEGWAPLDLHGTQAVLVWFLRRDENERGVVAHSSGWMDYGHMPWLNHHLAVLARTGTQLAAKWVSSGLEADAVSVEPPATVLVRRTGLVTRYEFHGWQFTKVGEGGVVPDTSSLLEVVSVGDVMLGRGTARALDALDGGAFADVQPLFDEASLRFGNLEGCATAHETSETAFHFFAPRRHLPVLTSLGFDVLSVANNHCAPDDVVTTKALVPAALGPWETRTLRRAGLKIGVVALHVPSGTEVTAQTSAHAQVLDALASQSDVVFALVHWGVEYSPEPTMAQRDFAAWLFAHGVRAVLGHHPHVVQPLEVSDAGVVAFSEGNFVFDQEGWPTGADGGTEHGEILQLRFHPVLGMTARGVSTVIEGRAVVKLKR